MATDRNNVPAHGGEEGSAELAARAIMAASRSAYLVEKNVKTPLPIQKAARLQARAWGELALSMLLNLRHQEKEHPDPRPPDTVSDLGKLRAWPLKLSHMYEGQIWTWRACFLTPTLFGALWLSELCYLFMHGNRTAHTDTFPSFPRSSLVLTGMRQTVLYTQRSGCLKA